MKRISLFLLALLVTLVSFADKLILIQLDREADIQLYISDPNIAVNYYNAFILVATVADDYSGQGTTLETDAWQEGISYMFSYTADYTEKYMADIASFAKILFRSNEYLIIKVTEDDITKLYPVTHNGLDAILRRSILPVQQRIIFDPGQVSENPVIAGYVAEVDTLVLMPYIQHLQDYGTRNCFTPQAVQAQNWIKETFESYDLPAVLHDFMIGSQNPSDNVIATQTGLIYPDEYVVVGGHYDSYVFSGSSAPGADDNASGTSGVLEIARVLSQYDFSRSIIYCAFSGEEYGLYGSAAWVSWAKANDLDILGYINLDMIGYVHPGNGLHTHIIAPSSAQPLVDYYTAVANIYVPDMGVFPGTLSGGNSDHSSFNAQGYMGIFPFEDSQLYSPYIHSANDIMGLSVNSTALAWSLTKAALATVAKIAAPFNGFYPPMNLDVQQAGNAIQLNWNQPLSTVDFLEYKVYRNDVFLSTITNLDETTFSDSDVVVGEYYAYYVTAVYGGDLPGESFPSNSAGIAYGLMTIFDWDFESGVQGWSIKNTNLGWKWGLNVPISGNSTTYLGINSDAYGQNIRVVDYAISPVLDLTDYFGLSLEFDYGFRKYSSDIMKVLYRTGQLDPWIEIANLNQSLAFINFTIPLPDNAISDKTQVAFFYDDYNTWAWYAALDNVKITGFDATLTPVNDFFGITSALGQNYPNPASGISVIDYSIGKMQPVKISLYNLSGKRVGLLVDEIKQAGKHSLLFDASLYQNGIYFYTLETDNHRITKKMVIIR